MDRISDGRRSQSVVEPKELHVADSFQLERFSRFIVEVFGSKITHVFLNPWGDGLMIAQRSAPRETVDRRKRFHSRHIMLRIKGVKLQVHGFYDRSAACRSVPRLWVVHGVTVSLAS